jgi:hypothetical protein
MILRVNLVTECNLIIIFGSRYYMCIFITGMATFKIFIDEIGKFRFLITSGRNQIRFVSYGVTFQISLFENNLFI